MSFRSESTPELPARPGPARNGQAGPDSALQVAASWERCEKTYGLDPRSRLPGNRFSQHEVKARRERVEEPLAYAEPLIDEVRDVARRAQYSMLIADAGGAVIQEYCDSDVARQLKTRGICIGTLWDEPCVGTNGIGTALATSQAITVNGDEHYHSSFRQFICAAAPLFDQRGERYGALNLTGHATDSDAERSRLDHYVRRTSRRIHTQVFRQFFRDYTLVGITDSLFSEVHQVSRLLAIDEHGCVVGATNDVLDSLRVDTHEQVIGESIDQLLGLDYDRVLANDVRLHRLEQGVLSGRFALNVAPGTVRTGSNTGTTRATSSSAAASSSRVSNSSKAAKAVGADGLDNVMSLDFLAGEDQRMRKLVKLSRRLLGNSPEAGLIPILLQGETGTGKDTFARALHAESQRRGKPFVELNCAAIPETLVDSEMFGYAPGTFTGGLKEGKAGHVQAADGGTLFLDEIGDMPLESQSRLLRVLAERKVQPLGVARALEVDFQLVCASHRDLLELVQAGRFREDLYYRVCGASMMLPALRERQDFRAIALRLLRRFDPAGGVKPSEEVWQVLHSCQWPGNIRQLYNVMQYLVFSCGHGEASLEDLPDELTRRRATNPAVSAPTRWHQGKDQLDRPAAPTLHSGILRSRRDELLEALVHTRWCVSKAARLLGVSRATVHRQMKKYELIRPDHQ